MNMRVRMIFYILFFVLFLPCSGLADELASHAPYTVQYTRIESDGDFLLCIQLEPHDGYYTYAPSQKNVYPTEIRLTEKLQEIPVLFPVGVWKEDSGLGQKVRVFEGTARIYLLFPEKYTGSIEISFLACSKEHCQPFIEQRALASVPITDIRNFSHKHELESLYSAYLQKKLSNEQLGFAVYNPQAKRTFSAGIHSEQFVPDTQKNAQNFAMQGGIADAVTGQHEQSGQNKPGETESFSLTRLKEQSAQKNTQELLKQENSQGRNIDFSSFSARPYYQELEVQSLLKALLFGIVAGFILNFMPCVLPVIALKLHALLTVPAQGTRFFREQMLFFALGILAWFVVLAFLFGGLGLTWGQLFQEYWLMLALCILVFVLALSLFDVFHLPIINLRNHEHTNAKFDTFLSGFLATILATPCSGPLLGGVLGFVLTQSFVVIVLVFVCMGLGMALPYFLFACKPSLASFMPKAGNWLLVLEKALAFFLLGTALYLFSLLPEFLYLNVLFFLFFLCICLYIWGKWASVSLGKLQKRLTLLGLFCCIVLCFWYLFMQPVHNEKHFFWKEFQTQDFLQKLGQKNLLVKFTADWCPTCKVLEKTVFTEKNMQELAQQTGEEIQFVLVDMTQFDEEKQNLLTSLGSASIPFFAVFPKNNPYQPLIVRDIYTLATVQQVLKKAVEENAGK